MKEIRTSEFSKIKRMFYMQKEDKPLLGDYINLCYIIKGRNYKQEDINKAFLKLVSRDEYLFNERYEYINYLCQITQKQK